MPVVHLSREQSPVSFQVDVGRDDSPPWAYSPYMRYDRRPDRFEHRGMTFRISNEAVREAEATPTQRCRETPIKVDVGYDSPEFENALAMALIPLLAKKIRALNAGEYLPTIIRKDKSGDTVLIGI